MKRKVGPSLHESYSTSLNPKRKIFPRFSDREADIETIVHSFDKKKGNSEFRKLNLILLRNIPNAAISMSIQASAQHEI